MFPSPFAAECEATILVVDDSLPVRTVVSLVLGDLGFRVLQAGTPDEASALVEEEPGVPDLVVCDLILPGASGGELASRLRRRSPTLRFLFMTGLTRDEALARGLLDEDSDVIEKPFSIDSLTAAVQSALGAPLVSSATPSRRPV